MGCHEDTKQAADREGVGGGGGHMRGAHLKFTVGDGLSWRLQKVGAEKRDSSSTDSCVSALA